MGRGLLRYSTTYCSMRICIHVRARFCVRLCFWPTPYTVFIATSVFDVYQEEEDCQCPTQFRRFQSPSDPPSLLERLCAFRRSGEGAAFVLRFMGDGSHLPFRVPDVSICKTNSSLTLDISGFTPDGTTAFRYNYVRNKQGNKSGFRCPRPHLKKAGIGDCCNVERASGERKEEIDWKSHTDNMAALQ